MKEIIIKIIKINKINKINYPVFDVARHIEFAV